MQEQRTVNSLKLFLHFLLYTNTTFLSSFGDLILNLEAIIFSVALPNFEAISKFSIESERENFGWE